MRHGVMLRATLALLVGCILLTGCDWFTSPQERIARAEQYMANGESRRAVIELQNALQSEPRNARARLLLAQLSLLLGDAASADKELARAIADGAAPEQTAELATQVRLALGEYQPLLTQLDQGQIRLPEPAQSTNRGLALLGLQQIDPALQSFDRALAADQRASRARIGKAQAHMQGGHSDAALTELERVLAVNPKEAYASLLRGMILAQRGDYRSAVATLTTARDNANGQLTGTQYESLLVSLAQAQLATGDIAGARGNQAELAKHVPDSALQHYLAARIAMAEQKYPEAVAEAQRALALAPDQLTMKLLVGAALLANGNLNQAEAHLADVVQSVPDNVEARKLLAQVNMRLQRPDVAMQVLAPVQQQDSVDPQVGALLGRASLQRGMDSAGIDLLERSAAAQPDNAQVKLDLALAYISSGQGARAVELLEKIPAQARDARREALLIAATAAAKGTAAAKAEVERAVASQGNDVAVLNIAALFFAEQREFAQARRYQERALTLEPKNVSTLMNAARIAFMAGDDAGARATLEQVLTIDPASKTARIALTQLALRAGDTRAAIARLEEVRGADPKAVEPRLRLAALYLQQKQDREADDAIREAVAAADNKAVVLDAAGRMYLEAGRYEQALARFRDASGQDARNPQPLLNAARAQLALGNIAAARESIEKARALQPGSAAADMLLITVDLRDGRKPQALARLAELKKAHPQDAAVALLDGDVSMATDSPLEAARAYALAYKLAPSGPAAVRNYLASAKAGLAAPSELLEAWVKRQPNDVPARLVLAEATARSGNRPHAIELYEALAQAAPKNAMVLNNLAWLYYESQDARALPTAKRAYELAPDNGPVADTYGWILVRSGKHADGLPILERAVTGSRNPEIRYHYAVALAGAGQKEKAKSELEELTRGDVQFAGAQDAHRLLGELKAGPARP